MNLLCYDQRRIAIVVLTGGQCSVLRGRARYVREPQGENALWIDVDNLAQGEGNLSLVLLENAFDGEIVPDTQDDCDFRLVVAAPTA